MDVDDSVRNQLFCAIQEQNTEIAKLLLDRGIDFRVRYTGKQMKNMDAMAFALEWGATEIVELLQDRHWIADHPKGERNLVKEFWEAMRSGAAAVKALLDEDPSRIHLTTPFGTLLHDAERLADLETVKLLLERGVDIDRKSEGYCGTSALYDAARSGRLDVVRCLLDHGARMDTSSELVNPLFAAISYDHPKIARLLIDRGIDYRVKYKKGPRDALAFAKYWEAKEVIKLLKEKMKSDGTEKDK